MQTVSALLAVAVAYLLGSIPTGYLMGRMARGVDVRELGDRYTGAKNVYREIGPAAGALTLLGDILKGSLATLQVSLLALPEPTIIAIALAAVAGHIWPVFLQFRGGAGLATALGVLFVALPRESLILIVPFAVAAWVSRAGANLGPACALLLPPLLALSWWLGEPLPRILLPLLVGGLVAARVYRDRLGSAGRKFFGAGR
ncbi:MAG: glycerol-3-phosphate acyltransferase [Chloroflexi bacterium]|nr:glycerol-3-phosphate acyltransferase [Chloroflexota bacterium]